MAKYQGEAADERLAQAWAQVHSSQVPPSRQPIVHILTPDAPGLREDFATTAPYQKWRGNGRRATDKVFQALLDLSQSWSYIEDARRARVDRIVNIRIIIPSRSTWNDPDWDWIRYQAEVLLPFFRRETDERAYLVWAEDCQAAGLPVRPYDVNLWGPAGLVLTSYNAAGEVSQREFPDEDGAFTQDGQFDVAHLRRTAELRSYVSGILGLALSSQGHLIPAAPSSQT